MTIKPVTFQFHSVQDAEKFVQDVIKERPLCVLRQHGDRVTCHERFSITQAQRVATPLPSSELEAFTV